MSVEPVETPIQSILCAVLSCSVVSHSVALWTVALQAPLSMGFSREEYWSGLPCPFPGDLSNPGIEPRSTTVQVESFQHYPFLSSGEGNGTPLQYSCLENPMKEEPGGLQSMGSLRVGHDWATSLSLFTVTNWRRKWQPTPVLLPGKSHEGGAW